MDEKGLNPRVDSETADLENPEIRERINHYIDESFPETEERIAEQMRPECEVSIVIPAFNERDYILRCLESLANQEGVGPNQFEAIFVINNPSEDLPRDTAHNEKLKNYKRRLEEYHQSIDNNQEALKVLRNIQSGNIEDLDPEEKKIAEKVKESGIHFYVIDKASSGNELPLEYANVGGARNRGTAEAVSRFLSIQENGIIAHTDGDTRVRSDYVEKLIKVFSENPDVIGVAGNLRLEVLEGKEALPSEYIIQEDMRWACRHVIKDLIARKMAADKGEEPKQGIEFFGPNMAGRAFDTALVNGLRKSAGGEDTDFGKRLALRGKTINAPDIMTFPANRKSAKTSTGQGVTGGWELLDEIEQKGGIYMQGYERDLFEMEMGERARELIENKDASVDSWKKVLTHKRGDKTEELLNEEQLQELSAYLSGSGGMLLFDELTKSNEILKLREAITSNMEKVFPKVPLLEEIDFVQKEFLKDEVLAAEYKRILDEFMKRPGEITDADIMPAKNSKLRESFIAVMAMRKAIENQEREK